MNTNFIKQKEKQEIIEKLKNQFGIQDLDFEYIQSAKEKVRAFSGNLSQKQIYEIASIAPIETIGLYLTKTEKDLSLRLSLDATHILKDKIQINTIQLDENEAEQWMKGSDLPKKEEKGVKVIQHNSDFLGCAKSTSEVLLNHIPKDRRTR